MVEILASRTGVTEEATTLLGLQITLTAATATLRADSLGAVDALETRWTVTCTIESAFTTILTWLQTTLRLTEIAKVWWGTLVLKSATRVDPSLTTLNRAVTLTVAGIPHVFTVTDGLLCLLIVVTLAMAVTVIWTWRRNLTLLTMEARIANACLIDTLAMTGALVSTYDIEAVWTSETRITLALTNTFLITNASASLTAAGSWTWYAIVTLWTLPTGFTLTLRIHTCTMLTCVR